MIDLSDYELTLDLVSSGLQTIDAGQTVNIDVQIQDPRILTGLEYIRTNGNPSDTATFQIIYNDQVVRQFATDVLMVQGHWRYEAYASNLIAGMVIRLIYKNNGQQAAQFGFNLIRHARRNG